MTNVVISSKLADILAKVNTILNNYMKLEEDYLQLLGERNFLKEKIQDQSKLIQNLEGKVKDLMLSRDSVESKTENEAIKATIEQFIQDMDQCIELLDQ